MAFNLYQLVDPVLNQPVYIGMTSQPLEVRLVGHMGTSSHALRKWIQTLRRKGLRPRIELIEVVEDENEAKMREIELIQNLSESTPAFMVNDQHARKCGGDWGDKRNAYCDPEHFAYWRRNELKNITHQIQRVIDDIRDLCPEQEDFDNLFAYLWDVCIDPLPRETEVPNWMKADIQAEVDAHLEQLYADCGVALEPAIT